MKLNELRIGSLVDVINRSHEVHLPMNVIRKVGHIEFFKVRLYEHDKPFATQAEHWEVDTADLSPIPLTEELLLKFGFVFGNNHGFYVLLEDNSKGDYNYDNVLFVLQYYGDDTCKYVHQLQNIYFALTGEELQILGTDRQT